MQPSARGWSSSIRPLAMVVVANGRPWRSISLRSRVGSPMRIAEEPITAIGRLAAMISSPARLMAASGAGAEIDAASLPIPAAAREWFARTGLDPILAACAGGDDYELLFAVPKRARGRLRTVIRQARGVAVTRIGCLTKEPQIALLRNGAAEPLPPGFVHF